MGEDFAVVVQAELLFLQNTKEQQRSGLKFPIVSAVAESANNPSVPTLLFCNEYESVFEPVNFDNEMSLRDFAARRVV